MAFHHATVDDTAHVSVSVPRTFAWVVFALTFGLLISDYMSRQVLNAVFPLLKSEWALSDAQLGMLSSIVSVMVGLLTIPLSLLADRWGRVKSLVLMAVFWSLATLGCAVAESFNQMFIARFLVGVGEAAYGSVGIAVVLSVFPKNMRASLSGAFMAGTMFGSVLGMALGGIIAAHMGWRIAFASMALFGLVLAGLYLIIVRERRIAAPRRCSTLANATTGQTKRPLFTLFASRSVISAYVGNGLQAFVVGSVLAWFPSYLNRYYHMNTDKAGMLSALIVLIGGGGMIICGMLGDRMCRTRADRKIVLAISFCLISCFMLTTAFYLQPGLLQLSLIGMGMLVASGTCGPAGAMVANLTHPAVHATAFAVLVLANNILGLAPGPLFTGMLADKLGLDHAFQFVPLMGIAAALVFGYGKRHYHRDLEKLDLSASAPAVGPLT
ncbi:sugar efflux transporter [Pseudomonas fluorescens]|uniref:MFS transporter n=1 Tax=Pseudomonas fluorescens TaxID=294 RepID=UPI0012407244|nr:MFS transporter [Pseudomonas fluorescens]VVQ16860.1 sugar efflux transporter [Pseudomonas fluorescens]